MLELVSDLSSLSVNCVYTPTVFMIIFASSSHALISTPITFNHFFFALSNIRFLSILISPIFSSNTSSFIIGYSISQHGQTISINFMSVTSKLPLIFIPNSIQPSHNTHMYLRLLLYWT